MFDDSVMVIIAVVTLGRRKLQEKEGRWLKLVSGVLVLALGVVMLVNPELLMWKLSCNDWVEKQRMEPVVIARVDISAAEAHRNASTKLNKQRYHDRLRSAVRIRVKIPDRDRIGCLKDLNKMNIHRMSLFPDLDGACKYINALWELGWDTSLGYIPTELKE